MNAKGYAVNTNALGIISICDDWYANRVIEDFHRRENLNGITKTISRLNFAKRCCSDDANLCEIISITPEEESLQEFIDTITAKNRFDVQYRKQLEKVSAEGTAGAYIYIQGANYMQQADGTVTAQGGKIRINYCDADCIIPLTVDNDIVTECAFASTNIVKGKEQSTLVIFTMDNAGIYTAETVTFNEHGEEQDYTSIRLGDKKPFSIMQNAEVNNLDNMEGYGLPKIYNTIPFFKAIDLCYALLYGDLDKGEKLVFINELLACIQEIDGKPELTAKQKEVFILLGEKLPDQPNLVHEYNPDIRVDTITKCFELVLSLISLQFGYGTKKYTFENGQITTATQYIGERQDEMQELNKQRKQAEDYITDLIQAALWFSNQFQGTAYNVDEELSIEFDDSYIEDKATLRENMRADALNFPEIKELQVMYFMEAYNITEEEAWEWVNGAEEGEEPEPGDDEEPEEDDMNDDEINALLDSLLE